MVGRDVNIHLVTGSAVHAGVAALLLGKSLVEANAAAQEEYETTLKGRLLEDISAEWQTKVKEEHKWIITGLLIVFKRQQLDKILEEFDILTAEKDICIPWGEEKYRIWFESKIDALLYHRENKSVHCWSIKTMETWNWYKARKYNSDTQVLLETYGGQELLRRMKKKPEYSHLPDKIYSTKFCFMIKGKREYEEEILFDGTTKRLGWETNSPLVRGYKNAGLEGFDYAFSKKINKPENKSGWGYLPKNWEEFKIWEEESLGHTENKRMLQWVKKLELGEAVGFGNPLEQLIVIPQDYIVDREEIADVVAASQAQEAMVRTKIIRCETSGEWNNNFRRNYDACFDGGTRCRYWNVCRGDDKGQALEDVGFVKRISHHKKEKAAQEEKLG